MRRSDKSLAWTSALSFGAHGLFALFLALAPRPPAFVAPLESNEIRLIEVADLVIPEEMEAEVTEIVEAVESDPATPGAAPRAPLPRTLLPRTGMPSDAPSTESGLTGAIVTSPAIEAPMVPGESEADRERRLRAMGTLLAPSRVAAGIVLRDDPGPVMPSGPAGLDDPGGETVRTLTVAEAERRHDGHLGAAAATKTYLHDTHPELAGPHPDGSYTYRGHAFTATIQPDGHVVYSDRGGVEYDVTTGTGSFDLGDMVMGAAGQDPYAQEREWFETEHEELIDRLVDEARVAARAHALRRLPNDLSMIWANRTRSAERRRRQLFERWDEASEDEGDREARDIIMAYIREHVPQDSEDAYTEAEIAALNARRESTERFSPY